MLFSEVLVPQSIKNKLRSTVQSGRISHAQLFLGQEGMPTLALALAYCQYISCKQRTDDDACGVCPSCIQFNNIAHPDLHFYFPNIAKKKKSSSDSDDAEGDEKKGSSVDFYEDWRQMMISHHAFFSYQQWLEAIQAENKRPIINVRDASQIVNTLITKPYEADYHFIIIWMPEKMNAEAASKLLKTIEEPDGKTLFILVSEHTENILPTIISRTQMVKVNKFNMEDMASIVAEKKQCSMDVAIDIVNICNGNLLEALSLEEEEETENEQYNLFVEMMRSAYRMCYCYNNPAKVEFSTTKETIDQLKKMGREKQMAFLTYSLNLVRKCLMLNCGAADIVHSSETEKEWLKLFSPFINKKNGAKVVEALNTAIQNIAGNANVEVLFVDLFLTLGQLIQYGDERRKKKI